jgi:hypothetical protein
MSDTVMDCPGVNALEASVASSVNRLSIMYMSWEQQVGCDDDERERESITDVGRG